METLSTPQQIVVWILPLLFAITVHEAAHAWTAWKLGDSTAKAAGRVSFNPINHIDPIGTIIVPLLMLIMTTLANSQGLIFGWAKPVPVVAKNLRNPRRDMGLVALAGPAANFMMALLWALLAKLVLGVGATEAARFLLWSGLIGIQINLMLLVLNLLPILPLDGGRILYALLPFRWAERYGQLEPYGLIILLALLVSNLLDVLIRPVLALLYQIFIVIL